MNQFEVIINKERDASYNLKNKDLFTLYTLTLINQEESKKRHKRNLIIYGVILFIPAIFFLPYIDSFINSYIDLWINNFIPLFYNPFFIYLFSLLISGFVILNKKTSNY